MIGQDIQKHKITLFSNYTEGRNRRDPLAILTIPITILHDPPTIPHTHVPIPVRVVAPRLRVSVDSIICSAGNRSETRSPHCLLFGFLSMHPRV